MLKKKIQCILLCVMMIAGLVLEASYPCKEILAAEKKIEIDQPAGYSFYEKDTDTYEKKGINYAIIRKKESSTKVAYYKTFQVNKAISKYNNSVSSEEDKISKIRYGWTRIWVYVNSNGEWKRVINPLDYVDIKTLENGKYVNAYTSLREDADVFGAAYSILYGKINEYSDRLVSLELTLKNYSEESVKISAFTSAVGVNSAGRVVGYFSGDLSHVYYVNNKDLNLSNGDVSIKMKGEELNINMKSYLDGGYYDVQISKDKKFAGNKMTFKLGATKSSIVFWGVGKYYIRVRKVFSHYDKGNNLKGKWVVKIFNVK